MAPLRRARPQATHIDDRRLQERLRSNLLPGFGGTPIEEITTERVDSFRARLVAEARLAVQVFPLSDVKAYMGHADIQTTMIYVHHVPAADAAERLSGAVRSSGDFVTGIAGDRPKVARAA